MDPEVVSENSSNSNLELLTAAELVDLRKSKEEVLQPKTGIKFSKCSATDIEKEAIEHAVENYKDILTQNRVARICDLMQAEWNEEINSIVTAKLKGKFVQHMGYKMGDKTALFPEEALFLLENGCLEITGSIPMSTEEAYAVLLNEHLSLEKYQVYSHLSQLGFIVLPHQKELRKKTRDSMKVPGKNATKRKSTFQLPEQPIKRLTFSGAISKEPDACKVSNISENNGHSINDDLKTIFSSCEESQNVKLSEIECNKSDKCEDVQPKVLHLHKDEAQPVHCTFESIAKISNDVSVVDQNLGINLDQSSSDHIEVMESNKSDECEDVQSEVLHKHNDKDQHVHCTFESMSKISNDVSVVDQNLGSNLDQSSCDHIEVMESNKSDKCEDAQFKVLHKHKDEDQPVQCTFENTAKISNDVSDVDQNFGSNLDQSSCDHIEVMDTDSQDEDIMFPETEKSNGGFEAENVSEINNETTIQSLDSQSELVNEDNSDVINCSSNSELFEIDTRDNDSKTFHIDDEITLLEVTKKETTPLAVIDLLSDEENRNDVPDEEDFSGSDDDIKIVKVCSGAPDNKRKSPSAPLSLTKIKSTKITHCKLEEGNNRNSQNSTPLIQFPDLFRKDLACVPRPHLNLLPYSVMPNKEVYILDIPRLSRRKSQEGTQSQGRMWNSYKDLQDYQRTLRQNRNSNHSIPRFQDWRHNTTMSRDYSSPSDHNSNFSDYHSRFHQESNRWTPSSSRNGAGDMDYRQFNSNTRQSNSNHDMPQNVNHFGNNASLDQKPFTDTNSPVHLGNNNEERGFQNPQFSNNISVNSTVSTGHSLLNVGLQSQPGNLLNFSNIPPILPNAPYRTPEIMAEVQRTAYSYATSMLSSMFGPSFNPSQYMPGRSNFDFGMRHTNFTGIQNISNLNASFQPQLNEPFFRLNQSENFRNKRMHRGEPFPCHYRSVNNKKSWTDVRVAIGEEIESSNSDSDDIEEIPLIVDEFLWNNNTICPIIKPGTGHEVSDVLKLLKVTKSANLTDKNSKNDKCFPNISTLEITYDVYLPGKNFKKSCPGIPNHRIIVVKNLDPIPRYSEIALLQRKWNDGAVLQIAVVDHGDISFCSFNSISLPDIVPFEK